ncbi:ATP-binding protein, partial [Acaryochloris marina NIES-2412]|uniref:ATP-binding protein n=1 Tax=Acaryochloris marina TaxID=155978 RepID=UPI0040595A6B
MAKENFKDAEIQRAQERFQHLKSITTDTQSISSNLWQQALVDFSHVLEELYVSNEELKQQNEELQLAQQTLAQQHNDLQDTRQELEVQRHRYQSLFDFAPDGYLITDMEGTIQEVNIFAEMLFNRNQTDLIEHSLLDFMVGVEPVQFQMQLHILKNSRPLIDWEVQLQPHSRSPIPVSIAVSAIFDPERHGNSLRWLVRDISDRKKVEIALEESEANLQSVLRNIPSYVLKMDREGQILYFNQLSTDDVYQDIIGTHFQEIITETGQDIQRIALEQVFRSEKPITIEVSGTSSKGREKTFEILIAPIFMLGKVESALIIATDFTERNRTRSELMRAKEAAEAANVAKSRFIANMSHEFRTPLNGVMGYSQLVLRDQNISSQQQEYIKVILRCGDHLLSLVDEVLTLSKLDAGVIIFEPEDVNLFQLCKILKDLFSLKAETKNIELYFHISESVPEYISTDVKKLKQILINLIGNALKFTDQGRVDCFVNLSSFQDSSQSHQLHFLVQDTGLGIPETFMEHLYSPFEQNPETRVKYGGLGLGLSICQEIVNFLGGEIHLSSREGQGTNAEFYIPIGLGHQSHRQEFTLRRIVTLADNQPIYRILVVEDLPENREPLVQLLQSVGYEVQEASNGQAALMLTQRWQPHLILMDLHLPQMSGLEATREIKKDPGAPIIIALTAQAFVEQEAKLAGCDDFIHKPYLVEETLHTLAEYLGATYTYQDLKMQHTYEPLQYSLKAKHLVVMPRLWIQRVYEASVRLDHDVLSNLFTEIPTQHRPLHSSLQLLVESCRFDIIID